MSKSKSSYIRKGHFSAPALPPAKKARVAAAPAAPMAPAPLVIIICFMILRVILHNSS